jgi:uncharacterized membrane protein
VVLPGDGHLRRFEPVRAYEIYLIFHLALAGVTTYLYCRQLGCRVLAALVGAAAYELGPFVTHISCCLINVQLGAGSRRR